MNPWVRAGVALLGVGTLALAAGFGLGQPWATGLWPVAQGGGSSYGAYGTGGASALSNLFVASVLASIGASALWVAARRETRAIEGGAIDIAVIAGGSAAASAVGWGTGRLGLTLALTALCALGLVLAWLAHGVPWRDGRRMPRFVSVAFLAFALILLLEGGGLVLGLPRMFPWALPRDAEVVYGFVFLGAMAFFLMARAAGTVGAAASILAGFLAYDLVLIGPLVGHLGVVEPGRLPSLLAYIAAVASSGGLAAWFLALGPAGPGLALHPGRAAR